MNDNWAVGDLALCIKVGQWLYINEGQLLCNKPSNCPKKGCFYKVVGIDFDSTRNCFGLVLEGMEIRDNGDEQSFDAKQFRKIKPDTEPCEEEFTVLIKRGRKVDA